MNADDIQLPEELTEENLRTWQLALETYQWLCSMPVYSQVLAPVFDWAKSFSHSAQAKSFRAGIPGLYLIISTKEKHGLEHGDPCIVIDVDDKDLGMVVISYFSKGTESAVEISCKSNEMMPVLQPLLNRLWDETRGKKINGEV